jgi:hypothetical protein
MLSYLLNNYSMSKHIIIFIAVAIIGFAVVNENIVVTAQTNSTNSNKQKIIVTWLVNANDTKTSDTPVIRISSEDFWKTFNPLLKQSLNGSTDSS